MDCFVFFFFLFFFLFLFFFFSQDIEAVLRATFYLIGEHKSAMEDWQKIKILVGKTGKLGLKRRLGQHKLEQVEKELAEFAITDLLRTVLECCNQY